MRKGWGRKSNVEEREGITMGLDRRLVGEWAAKTKSYKNQLKSRKIRGALVGKEEQESSTLAWPSGRLE